jgi:urea transport system permease protein
MPRSLALILLVAVWLFPGPGRAETAEEAYAAFATPNFDAIRDGVMALSVSGDPRALIVITALHDGRLYVRPDKVLFIKNDDGTFVDALTGAAADVPAGALKPVRVNNGVREAVNAALGVLRLFSPDASTRLTAAEAVFRARDPAALPALDRALAKETDPDVKTRLEQAHAAAVLSSSDTSDADRLNAISIMRARGDIEARSTLGNLTGQTPAVAAAAASAITAIDRSLQLWSVLESVYYGISLGSVLLLAAAGLAITFGVMGVINMAHGEMVMIGAYATYVTQVFFQAHFPAHESLYLVAAVPFALVTSMLVGALLEVAVIRHLYGRPLETLLATYGLSLLLIQVVRSLFGAQNVAVENPPWLSGGTELFEDVVIPYNRMAVVLFTVVVVAFVAYVLRGTPLGLRVRAVTQNRPMAACMGISTARVDTWTFALGCGVGGLGGVALSQLGNVGPELGQGVIVDSFLVVVLGGVGKIAGSVVAAFGLGILNKVLEPIAGAVLGKIVVLLAVILVIQKRPQGLFAPKGRSVEAA